jgi:RHS repeat-associated protein
MPGRHTCPPWLAPAGRGGASRTSLGSTSLTTDINGAPVAETRYLPYGEERWTNEAQPTDFTFTGQRAEAGFRLMDYNARYYDPGLGRFISPDSVVHNPSNPNDLNRYSYGRNNPLKYIDPTGHQVLAAGLGEVVLLAGLAYLACEAYEVGYQYGWGPNAAENRQALATAVNDVADQVGTAFNPPSVPSSNPDAFPLGPPPDPYYVPGPTLDTPEWSGLPGVPLAPDTETGAIDFPLEQQELRDRVLFSANRQTWPNTPEEMNDLLGVEGERISDGATTPGRNKVEWKPSDNVTIVHEQHPYHSDAPEWHRGPHWHLDTPNEKHKRFLPGDPIPGY